jgi:hypothetical protein
MCGMTGLECCQCNPGPCDNRHKSSSLTNTDRPLCLHLYRESDEVDVLLLPRKDGSGWSYVNMTKGHICPCVFPTYAEAIADLGKHGVRHYIPIELCEVQEMKPWGKDALLKGMCSGGGKSKAPTNGDHIRSMTGRGVIYVHLHNRLENG